MSTLTSVSFESLHPDSPHIIDAFEQAYASKDVAAPSVKNAHRLPLCGNVSFEASNNLNEMGYRTYLISRALKDGLCHNYVMARAESDFLILDGTWQQFIPSTKRLFGRRDKDREPLAKVMVGTPEMVVDSIAKAGVSKRKLALWSADSPDISRDKAFVTSRTDEYLYGVSLLLHS